MYKTREVLAEDLQSLSHLHIWHPRLISFNFDADPDPGSALEKMDPDPGHEHFFKIYWFFSTFLCILVPVQEAKILQIPQIRIRILSTGLHVIPFRIFSFSFEINLFSTISWIRCQDSEGGFAGGPGQLAHLAPTYAAVNSLVISMCSSD